MYLHCVDPCVVALLRLSTPDKLELTGWAKSSLESCQGLARTRLCPVHTRVVSPHPTGVSTVSSLARRSVEHNFCKRMWPFQHRANYVLAARPHPSRLLRIGPNRQKPMEHPASVPKMVIFVRSDLKMSTTRIATHAVHAALALYQLACEKQNVCARWKNTGEKKKVIRINGDEHLESLIKAARHHKLPAAVVRDGQPTARGLQQRTAISMLGPTDVLGKIIADVKKTQ